MSAANVSLYRLPLSIVSTVANTNYLQLLEQFCLVNYCALLTMFFPMFEMLHADLQRPKSSLVECAACVNTFPSIGKYVKINTFNGATNLPPI
jgi:hypothetical protein